MTTDMISSQPVVVQVSSGNQYIAVAVQSDNANGTVHCPSKSYLPYTKPSQLHSQVNCLLPKDPNVAQSAVGAEDPDEATHTNYEDYNSVYSNGSNSAGQMYEYKFIVDYNINL